jgi:hypothetical protein
VSSSGQIKCPPYPRFNRVSVLAFDGFDGSGFILTMERSPRPRPQHSLGQ